MAVTAGATILCTPGMMLALVDTSIMALQRHVKLCDLSILRFLLFGIADTKMKYNNEGSTKAFLKIRSLPIP
jgi:hypothetical protein